MTSTTTSTSTSPVVPTTTVTADHREHPEQAGQGAGFVTAALATGHRTVLQFFRTPQLLMMGTIQGALFLFMFATCSAERSTPGAN